MIVNHLLGVFICMLNCVELIRIFQHFQQLHILHRGNRKAGPDGGNGGIGGDVILQADVSVKQLRHVRKYLKGEDGGSGQTKACHGRNGKDLIVKVS